MCLPYTRLLNLLHSVSPSLLFSAGALKLGQSLYMLVMAQFCLRIRLDVDLQSQVG